MPVLPSSKNISTARILRDVCPKNTFSRVWGGTCLPYPLLPSSTPIDPYLVAMRVIAAITIAATCYFCRCTVYGIIRVAGRGSDDHPVITSSPARSIYSPTTTQFLCFRLPLDGPASGASVGGPILRDCDSDCYMELTVTISDRPRRELRVLDNFSLPPESTPWPPHRLSDAANHNRET